MRILFMGTPDFAVPSLQALIDNDYNVVGVVTQPDRPKGRKQTLAPPPVKLLANKYNIPVYQPEKISTPEYIDTIKNLQVDLIITAAFGQLLSKELLMLPRLGCINVHASLLPKYRGGAPIHWAVINGETETGVTIMYMAEKLDAGAIISQLITPILSTDTTGDVYEKVTVAGAKLLIETLPLLISGKVQAIEQDDSEATFAYNIKREDELINWQKSANEIYNLIRGLSPWPGAYTLLDGQIIKVWKSEIVNNIDLPEEVDYEPNNIDKMGTIVELDKDGPIVMTGDGLLKLTEVQPAGKKTITGVDYINSGKIVKGMLFGN